MTNLTAVGLFSGCGGLDLGLEQAGFDVLLGTDVWEQATSTYEQNFDSTVLTADVTDLSGETLTSWQVGRHVKDSVGSIMSRLRWTQWSKMTGTRSSMISFGWQPRLTRT